MVTLFKNDIPIQFAVVVGIFYLLTIIVYKKLFDASSDNFRFLNFRINKSEYLSFFSVLVFLLFYFFLKFVFGEIVETMPFIYDKTWSLFSRFIILISILLFIIVYNQLLKNSNGK